ncbi:winged helix-turn-helix transcriptional regulator [Chitinophaga nivalis]|uniref:Helix-turn-helix transcriptional regulator n=1 Tax=Chitinophaga nivalis TaxID=2991709 RepID=A0ABT3IP67_9BACT|nr:helix-turn-helix domain-containing protein [Chitinophaga nivalis]MCW3464542.1 helix-turn-helix transcriptional regulator [Chitinophaga nivalis]MCW3485767.1 helix-turn-helix transcriptional regulator [Chitinophaga nivalis]
MYNRKIPRKYNCALEVTMDVLGGKWKSYIICYLRKGVKRPSELQKLIPDANRRVLNQQLKELEEHDIVAKTIYPVMPPKVEYYLTPFGEELGGVVDAMESWGRCYRDRFEDKSTPPEVV